MNFFKKGIRRIVHFLGEKKIFAPPTTLKWLYFLQYGRFPDIRHPQDLNEKLMRLSFFSDTSLWPVLADKYEVRKYIEQKGLKDILIPLYGVYDSFEAIDFNSLPESFVIKPTNGSGETIIVKNKSELNFPRLKKTITKWLNSPFGYATGEPHYLKIKPRVIIEKLLPSINGELPEDFKFYCFDSQVELCLVYSRRNIGDVSYKINAFDSTGKREVQNIIKPEYKGDFSVEMLPENFDEMIEIAHIISQDLKFARIDLYNIDGKIYFGEITLTPGGCRIVSLTHQSLLDLGKKLKMDD